MYGLSYPVKESELASRDNGPRSWSRFVWSSPPPVPEPATMRHLARHLPLALALAIVPIVSACDDTLGPADVDGTFMLTTPLPPVSIGATSSRVIADTFFVGADGLASKHTWIERTPSTGGASTVVVQRTDFSYRIEDGAIGFAFSCPSGAICAASSVRIWFDLVPTGKMMRSRAEPHATYVRVDDSAP